MKKLKKGFTLVELVIVIAVIAVLAAVLIPTFRDVIQNSKISADKQTVTNMNTALTTIESEQSAPQDMGQAIAYLNQEGFTVSSLSATANGYSFAWNQATNAMLLIDANYNVAFPEEAKITTQKKDCWVIANSANTAQNAAKNAFNIYFSADVVSNINLDGWVSVDTGVNKMTGNLSISGSTSNDIVLRGSFAKVNVDNENASVNQYGYIEQLTVTAIANQCFNVNGVVDKVKDVKAGKLINKGVINVVEAVTETGSIQNKGFIQTQIADEIASKVDNEDAQTEGTITVGTATELANIATAVNSGADFTGITVALTQNIDLTNRAWTPIGATKDKAYTGSFDGGNFTITGLSNEGYLGYGAASESVNLTNNVKGQVFGLFAFVNAVEGQELTFTSVKFEDVAINMPEGKNVGALIGEIQGIGEVNVANITVSGALTAKDKIGGVIGVAGYTTATTVNISGCVNNAVVTADTTESYNRAGGILGASGQTATLTLDHVVNTGAITANDKVDLARGLIGHAGGIIGSPNSANYTITNYSNTGTITAGNYGDQVGVSTYTPAQ